MKFKLLLSIALFISCQTFSQSIYLKGNFGVNISVNSDYYFLWADQVQPSGDSILIFQSHESVPYSIGGGKSYGGSFGYEINKYLTFDLAFLYANSSTRKFEIESDYTFPAAGYHVAANYDIEYDASNMSINPSLQITIPVGYSRFYSVFGLIFSNIKMKRSYSMDLYNNIPGYYPSEKLESKEEFDKQKALGFRAGAGFEYYLAEKLYLTIETSYNYLKYAPGSSRYTEYNYMDVDELESMSINEKEFEYVSSYNDLENTNPDKPKKELKYNYPFDHLAIQIGLKYKIADFQKKTKTD